MDAAKIHGEATKQLLQAIFRMMPPDLIVDIAALRSEAAVLEVRSILGSRGQGMRTIVSLTLANGEVIEFAQFGADGGLSVG